MKRYGNIYSKIYSTDNIKLAHQKARKNKTNYSEVIYVDKNEDFCIENIQQTLINKDFKTSDYKIFTKIDKGKERVIYKLPYYPDRIVQWAIMLQVEPIFMRRFSTFTHASLKGRGIHSALKQLDNIMIDTNNTKYCLKIDIKKFFPNINHQILKNQLRTLFKDRELLDLLDGIIDSIEGGIGVPIGNYLSQYFANFYLTNFDNWLKHELKIKNVIRYMDDIVIFHHDKKFLHELKKNIDSYLWSNLRLALKENWQVFPADIRGVDFVGYRHFRKFKLLRKSTYKRMRLKCNKLLKHHKLTKNELCTINSYQGWLKWCNSYNLSNKYLKPLRKKKVIR
ncbi:MAG: reverse transcriptase/maturase family protein [Terrisporobacter sp.]